MSMRAVPEKKHRTHFSAVNTPRGAPGPLGANFDGISGTNTIGQHSGLVPQRCFSRVSPWRDPNPCNSWLFQFKMYKCHDDM
eukprot:13497630-Alexandrium_andersonii.AAC.1